MLCLSCKDTPSLSEEEKLCAKIISSEVFAEKFRICDKVANEIFIYNITGAFKEMNFSLENYCEKTMQFLQVSVENEFEMPYTPYKDYPGILFQGFRNTSSTYEFTFIQLETDHIVKFVYDTNYRFVKTAQNFIN